MRVITSKSKNAESFYIYKGYVNDKGVSTSVIVRKLGALKELLVEQGPTRDDVMAWAKNEAKKETEKYKAKQKAMAVQITFHANRQIDYEHQVFYRGGYLFLQHIYYSLCLNKTCRKLRDKYKFKYDINAILSDLLFARVLEPVAIQHPPCSCFVVFVYRHIHSPSYINFFSKNLRFTLPETVKKPIFLNSSFKFCTILYAQDIDTFSSSATSAAVINFDIESLPSPTKNTETAVTLSQLY